MRALLALLCVLLFGGSAYAQAPMGSPLTGFYPGFRTGLKFVKATSTLPCAVTNNGVSPSVCMDLVNSSYSNTLTTDTGVKSGTGVTCTGTQSENFSETFPGTPFMVVVDATYPTSGSSNAYAFTASGFGTPNVYTTTGPINVNASAATSSRTGSVETALYWSGSAWSVSFAGDAVVSAGTTAPSGSAITVAMCNAVTGGAPLTTPFRSYRRYNGTFTNAQIQTAATQ